MTRVGVLGPAKVGLEDCEEPNQYEQPKDHFCHPLSYTGPGPNGTRTIANVKLSHLKSSPHPLREVEVGTSPVYPGACLGPSKRLGRYGLSRGKEA